MSFWLSSDLHLYHENVIPYCNRPFSSVEEMNETIVNNLNSRIGNGVLFHVGDFAFQTGRKFQEIQKLVNRFTFTTIHIVGNHDKAKRLKEFGFKHVFNEAYITYANKVFWLHHIPLQSRQGDSRYFRPKPAMGFDYCISGHIHSQPADRMRLDPLTGWLNMDIGIDSRGDYTPWHIDEVIAEFERYL